jgi:hypothetical protein
MKEMPTRASIEVVAAVAKKLTPKVIEWENQPESDHQEVEDTLKELLTNNHDWDGFQLAKDLDDGGWCPDAGLVEILDEATHLQITEHGRLVKEWIEANGVQPKFQVGDKVSFRLSFKPHTGTIKKVYPETLQYVIDQEGRTEMGDPVIEEKQITKLE